MRQTVLLFFAAAIIFSAIACNSNNSGVRNMNGKTSDQITADTANYTTILWVDSMRNIGNIKFGDKVDVSYTFKNTGNKPLFITAVRPTCGCTVADYTKEAVLPGDEGMVKAVYDSNHGVPGSIRKSIVVSSNTKNDPNFVLAFTGMVTK